jgi:hypothetical protein
LISRFTSPASIPARPSGFAFSIIGQSLTARRVAVQQLFR